MEEAVKKASEIGLDFIIFRLCCLSNLENKRAFGSYERKAARTKRSWQGNRRYHTGDTGNGEFILSYKTSSREFLSE